MSSSSAPRNGERMIHQDFIARIRYSNALPPPQIPPKLLEIPNTGLASGQYTNPGFASRLAREQPLNIEADAELGMPLDLVGMPGVFDGDESSIYAPSPAPPVHPHDRALLKPLSTLGKPRPTDAAVSFLRRTEYISSSGLKHRSSDATSALRAPVNKAAQRVEKKRASPEPDAGTPAYVKRKIERSFEAAQAGLRDYRTPGRVRHPIKKNLRPVEAWPIFPDLKAFPDSGAYVTVKFTHNPVPSSSTYDTRLLAGVFKPIERTEAEEAEYESALQAHELDPERNPRPTNSMNYDFYLPDTAAAADHFRQKFDVDNPARDDEALYTSRDSDTGAGVFNFNRVRGYETAEERELTHATKYDEEILLAYTDSKAATAVLGRNSGGSKGGAVLYYPIMQRSTVRSQRDKNIARTIGLAPASSAEEEQQAVDQLDVTVADPTPEMRQHVARIKADPLHFDEQQEENAPAEVSNGGGEGDAGHNGEQDGEGEEDQQHHQERQDENGNGEDGQDDDETLGRGDNSQGSKGNFEE